MMIFYSDLKPTALALQPAQCSPSSQVTTMLGTLLHSCKALNTVECNYEIHDTEMLSIIWGLEEWCHYLDSVQHPVKIWTDHKNLEYFRVSQKLNQVVTIPVEVWLYTSCWSMGRPNICLDQYITSRCNRFVGWVIMLSNVINITWSSTMDE
jgi:hypothetical protein